MLDLPAPISNHLEQRLFYFPFPGYSRPMGYFVAGQAPARIKSLAPAKGQSKPSCKFLFIVYTSPMSPYKKAEAACKRLKKKYGPNRLASLCMNGQTGGPISRQAVEAWKVIPLVHVRRLSELENCTMDTLRPDLWSDASKPHS